MGDAAAAAGGPSLQVWSTKGVEGVHRFLARVYRLVTEGGGLSEAEPTRDQLRLLHQTIKKARGAGAGRSWLAGGVNGALLWRQLAGLGWGWGWALRGDGGQAAGGSAQAHQPPTGHPATRPAPR